jgi:hypothetical protein
LPGLGVTGPEAGGAGAAGGVCASSRAEQNSSPMSFFSITIQ